MTNLSGFIITKSPTLKNRALNYGDGCFSTMLSNKGQVELLHRHVMRLLTDAKKLHILNDEVIFTINDLKVLINDFALNSYKLSNKNDQAEYQVVKLLIARGDSERGYTPSLHSSVVLVPSSQNYHRIANRTVGLGLARMTLAEQPILSGINI